MTPAKTLAMTPAKTPAMTLGVRPGRASLGGVSVPRLVEIRRYPVKAMGGESLASVTVDRRGLAGDRAYAVVDGDGKIATGKHSRRFRRRDAVFEFAASTTDYGLRVGGRGGEWAAPGVEVDRALSAVMGAPVSVLAESATPYFDAGAVSLVGTASLRWFAEQLGIDADRRRLRPNLVVATEVPFEEEGWAGRVSVGTTVLAPVERIVRCRMVDIAQEGLPREGRWLKALTESREMFLGVYLGVVHPGIVTVGDELGLADC
jgi:uncharacterized protein